MPMQELRGNSQLGADLAHFVFIEGRQRLDDSSRVNQFLNSGDTVVMGLYDISSRRAARLDRIGINGPLPQDPMAVQKMTGAQNPLLHGNELLADDVPLLLRIANSRERTQKLAFGSLDMKGRSAQLREQPAHVFGLSFPHEPGVDINAIHAFRPKGAKAQRVGNRRVNSAADEEEHIAIARHRSDLLL